MENQLIVVNVLTATCRSVTIVSIENNIKIYRKSYKKEKKKMKRKVTSFIVAFLLAFLLVTPFSAKTVKSEAASALKPVDVYMLMGQSNAAGHTKISNNPSLLVDTFPNVLMAGVSEPDSNTGLPTPSSSQGFTRLTYASLSPVKAGLGRNSNCVGPEYGMAKALNSKYSENNKAIIFKYAKGGTALTVPSDADGVWLSPSLAEKNPAYSSAAYKMYPRMKTAFVAFCNDLKANGYQPVVKGIAWHQGEADKDYPEAYRTAIKALVQDLRRDITEATGVDSSAAFFALGEISPTFGGKSNFNQNSAFIRMTEEVVSSSEMSPAATVDASDLLIHTLDGVCIGSDQYHFNVEDIITLGERFAAAFSQYQGKNFAMVEVTGNGSCGVNKAYFENGEEITFTVAPDENNLLVSFKVDDVDKTAELNNGKYTITANGNVKATVVFREKALYEFTIEGKYNIKKTKTTRSAYEGELIYVTPSPKEGQEVVSVTFNGEDMTYNEQTKRYERENANCDGTIVITYRDATTTGTPETTPNGDNKPDTTDNKKGCGKEGVGLALAGFATLLAAAFIIKK